MIHGIQNSASSKCPDIPQGIDQLLPTACKATGVAGMGSGGGGVNP